MTTSTIAPVRASIVVDVPLAVAFEVFTAGYDTWNPREHAIGDAPVVEFVNECREGGRIYQRLDDGTECDEGRILVWDPPHRMVASWAVSPQWRPETDPAKQSEYEVTFTELGPEQTRVDLEHRHFERHGDGADGMRAAVAAPDGWQGSLALAKAAAEARA